MFAYYVIFPPAAKYLLGLGQDFRLLLKADDYFDFIIIVMRGMGEADLQPMMQSPITVTTFKDDLAPGTRRVYAVRAVDKAGNLSAPSNRAEETAR